VFSRWSIPFRFPSKSLLMSLVYAIYPAHLIPLHQSNNIQWNVLQIMQHLIIEYSSACSVADVPLEKLKWGTH
jgi:hypothetical protein